MATYLKRTSKLFDISVSRASGDVSLRDLMCPVCRGILIEPVTLPCTHNLCLRCLKGTFEHNSLSCPLCRVRVGSWLRTATKSETLVNSGLWEFIRAKFPKEVEDKHNGDERDIDLETGYTSANKILSAAGEIRQEYEAQLQRVEEERRCQIEAEQMASEALIRKLQAEEQQQQLMLLAQDQLFAKTLAKKQVTEKQSEGVANYGKFPNASLTQCSLENKKYNVNAHIDVGGTKLDEEMDNGKVNLLEMRDASELRRPNIALISKIRAERYASSMKVNANNVQKESTVKFCCQKPMPVYNAVTKTLTQQSAAKVVQPCTSNYITEPGPSVSKIYGKQSKEELHVPNDIVSNKKKSLGIEVCVTSGDGNSRIGSAESAGSHDSINQEIHHFKPIKAIPRTPLKISADGRQIDPKLIRVVPILKRISNAVPKPPSQTHFKRIIGCSWSAFRGKTKENLREKEVIRKCAEVIDLAQKASTSCEEVQISEDTLTKLCGTNQRVDFVSDLSYDTNKNYTKSENKIINGVKIGKRLNAEAQMGIDKNPSKGGLRKTYVKNGMVGKSRKQKNVQASRKGTKSVADEKDTESTDTRTSISPETLSKLHLEDDEDNEETARRSKRRKSQVHKRNVDETDTLSINLEPNYRRTTRKRAGEVTDVIESDNNTIKLDKSKAQPELKTAVAKSKRRKMSRSARNNTEDSSNSADSSNFSTSSLRKSARNAKHTNKTDDLEQSISNQGVANCRENFLQQSTVQTKDLSKSGKFNALEKASAGGSPHITDEDAIMDQERIEQLLQQEKEDFELAQRLQAKFDEMTRIAGRTRQSRRVIGSPNFELDLWKLDLERTAPNPASASTTTQPIDNQTVRTEVRKRGRPPKRVK